MGRMGSIFVASIGRTIHRGTAGGAAIVLPPAGAATTLADSTSAPALDYVNGIYQVPAGIRHITFWPTYTEGGSNGAVALGAVVSNGTESAAEPLVDAGNIDTSSQPGFGVENVYARRLKPQPAPGNNTPVVYPQLTVDVQPGWYVWLQAAEVGNTGSPGSLLVALTGSP